MGLQWSEYQRSAQQWALLLGQGVKIKMPESDANKLTAYIESFCDFKIRKRKNGNKIIIQKTS